MTHTPRADALEHIAATLGALRLLVGRRVLGRMALTSVAPTLDLSDLDVLGLMPAQDGTMRGMACAPDMPVGEVSVGDVARLLRIDPSRASRLVADLVAQGFLARAVAQGDARRAVLRRTAAGDGVFAEIRRVKQDVINEIMGDWPDARTAMFANDFALFTSRLEARLGASDPARDA